MTYKEFVIIQSSLFNKALCSIAMCSETNLQMVFASEVSPNILFMKILKLERPHTCENPLVLQHHHPIDSKLIAEVMFTIVKKKLNMSVEIIQDTIKKNYGQKVSYWKIWMTK